MRSILIYVVALLAGAAPAAAQMEPAAQPRCPADAEPIPPALSGWSARTPLTAAGDAAGLRAASLAIGRGVDLALRPTPQVHYVLRPENPGGSVSSGGMTAFTVDRGGTYRVALGSAAWIDVVRAGKAETSTAHGRGPACSGIRKMVDFTLVPGDYVLQIAGNGGPAIAVIVTRLP